MKENIEMFKFAESIPLEELFQHIKDLTGISDLKFVSKISENRYGEPIIHFKSQDLSEHIGFLKLIFSEIYIEEFNSQIVYDQDTNSYRYWCTIDFHYNHPNGGSNGCKFCTAYYTNGSWQFED